MNIDKLVRNSEDGCVEIYSDHVYDPNKVKFYLLKLRSGTGFEMYDPTCFSSIRVEKGSVIVATGYKSSDSNKTYKYLKKNQVMFLGYQEYYKLRCDEGEKAIVTMTVLYH